MGKRKTAKPETAVAYVLMMKTWLYNDEYYYPGDGSKAKQVYTDAAVAARVCALLNVDAIIAFGGDVFDTFGEENPTYAELVTMPWPEWRAYLAGHDIAPPAVDELLAEPDRDTLTAWWKDGGGEYDFELRRHVGEWTEIQLKAAAKHLNITLVEVVTVPLNLEPP